MSAEPTASPDNLLGFLKRPTLNPYRSCAYFVIQRLWWDLHPEAWRSGARLRQVHNSQVGRRGLILCNGPSLNRVDFEAILARREQLVILGLNKINLLFDRTSLRPDLVVAVNEKVLTQNEAFFNETQLPLYLDSEGRNRIQSRAGVTFLRATMPFGFARNLTMGYNMGGTVTYTAMQLAFHLGIRDLALVGCDHSFKTSGPANVAAVSGEHDENHFDPRYFSGGVQWDLPDIPCSEYHYSLAGQIFESFGGSITNCTDGGKLELYRRIPLETWLSQTRENSADRT